MKNTRKKNWTGAIVAILVLLWPALATALPRSSTLTVVPTTAGPWLCGPAFIMENMGGPDGREPTPYGMPVMPKLDPWYAPEQHRRINSKGQPYIGPASPFPLSPPNPNEVLCRPLFEPRLLRPVQAAGAYGGELWW